MGELRGSLHGGLQGVGKTSLLIQELAQQKLGLTLTRIDGHRAQERRFRLVPLAESEQGASDMKMQSSMLRAGLDGGAKACQGGVGPAFVEVQEPAHEVVARQKAGTSPRSWPHASLGTGCLTFEEGHRLGRPAKCSQACDAEEPRADPLRQLRAEGVEERERLDRAACVEMRDGEMETSLGSGVVSERSKRRWRRSE